MRHAPSAAPELANRAGLRYPLRMSSRSGRRLWAGNGAGCALVVALVFLTTGLPTTSFCCAPSRACCAPGLPRHAAPQSEMRSPIRDCCRPIVRKELPVTSEQLVPRPDAPLLAILSIVSPGAVNLPSESRPPVPAADPQAGPPPPPDASRAPPLS